MPKQLPYGSWPSPLSASDAATSSARFDGARFVGDDVWWGQGLPAEGGRTTVRRRRVNGAVEDILPAPWNARSRVHEYGGGAWTVTTSGILLFSERSDDRVWAMEPGSSPYPLTPVEEGARYGGLRFDADVLLAVRERHTSERKVPARDIVSIPLDGSAARSENALRVLASGSDFAAQPALSPDGTLLAWIAWNHPDMPWDQTTLRITTLAGSDIGSTIVVAGGSGSAPLQPVWSSPTEITFCDDPTGRWNLWRYRIGHAPEPVAPADADTGGGLWVLGARWFATLEDGRVVCLRTNGSDDVVVVDPKSSSARKLDLPLSSQLNVEDSRGTKVLITGSGARVSSGVWLVDIDSGVYSAIAGGSTGAEDEWMPQPRAVSFSGARGAVHAFDYPPQNPNVSAPSDELPPYVVFVHGGPTSHVGGAVSSKIMYFTSRGVGVLDVNYGGSTGYGRAYRERLRGQWGVVDVEDVAAAAAGLAAEGHADPRRLAIEGGSAGGWTVLSALARTDVFSAGISRYGVGDARTLATDTHDFEARYLDGLIGPLPDAESLYEERSPLTHVDGFTAPMLILQGADDAVVPPSQAEAIRDALRARGIPLAYVLYQGEGHGFRRQETIVDSLEKEIAFLGKAFGFTPDGVAALELS
ncbi:dipeptidyl aminopeptidase/acylaminoacyl peptidase [Microbacterium endophyticum]|uniref:Dipeptidyl aminopeptidase/acylaminoacyl peptidase n=1 Tax=Microbacterium endophyticum TaxID=1526412 RepID=A0A7W4YMC6_9MICO|nr:prolyl oligopeptidase family serine peptidase [Microbacterium endophyticum]MBB2976073.1 dipeptidyl aminopeptidase/acylaminoacyl peptidase [Microbacterium endophyticum]NIK35009.1 dipeptidyl aminopeptidase/acylaminoacyl peptidase [Microbacterium endophyticum]